MTNPKRKVNRKTLKRRNAKKTIQNGGYRSKKANKSKRKVNRKTLNRRKYRKTQSGGDYDLVLDVSGNPIDKEGFWGELGRKTARGLRKGVGNTFRSKNRRQLGNARNCRQRVANLRYYLHKANGLLTSNFFEEVAASIGALPEELDMTSIPAININDDEYRQRRNVFLIKVGDLVVTSIDNGLKSNNNSYIDGINKLTEGMTHLKKLIDNVVKNDEDDTVLCTGVSTVTKIHSDYPPPSNLPKVSGYQEWGGSTYAPNAWIAEYKSELEKINELIQKFEQRIQQLNQKFSTFETNYNSDDMLEAYVAKLTVPGQDTHLNKLIAAYSITDDEIKDKVQARINSHLEKIQTQINSLVRQNADLSGKKEKIDAMIERYESALQFINQHSGKLIALGNNSDTTDETKQLEEGYYKIMFGEREPPPTVASVNPPTTVASTGSFSHPRAGSRAPLRHKPRRVLSSGPGP